ncbi:MAG TPA: hypothetical protein VE011_07570 [Candidatus Dormibacteraeota bacterium]|nr:hypothetical protein [Candidatus Dormibacteraeota bacterium]
MDTRSGPLILLGGVAAWAVVLLSVPALLALPLAVGHAQLHAAGALAVLAPALAIAWRQGERHTLASAAPLGGLTALALAQLVESVGGLGYGPDNEQRVNGLVAFHDLGLAIMPIGLVAAVAGTAIGIGALVVQRTGRQALGAVLAALVLAVGGLGVKTMLGS